MLQCKWVKILVCSILLLIFTVPVFSREVECFIAGTKIVMADGSLLNIEDVKVGDSVKSVNIENMEIQDNEVLEVLSDYHTGEGDDYTVVISFSDGTTNHNTNSHPYYTKSKGYSSFLPSKTMADYGLDVKQLSVGDTVFKYNFTNELGEVFITDIQTSFDPVMTYNISHVANNFNFFANQILVHNDSGGGGGSDGGGSDGGGSDGGGSDGGGSDGGGSDGGGSDGGGSGGDGSDGDGSDGDGTGGDGTGGDGTGGDGTGGDGSDGDGSGGDGSGGDGSGGGGSGDDDDPTPEEKAAQDEINKAEQELDEAKLELQKALETGNNDAIEEASAKINDAQQKKKNAEQNLQNAKDNKEANDQENDENKQSNQKQQQEEEGEDVGDPVKTSTGTFVTVSTDIKISNSPISFERKYSGTRRNAHSLGAGWFSSIDSRIVFGVDHNLRKTAEDTRDAANQALADELVAKSNYQKNMDWVSIAFNDAAVAIEAGEIAVEKAESAVSRSIISLNTGLLYNAEKVLTDAEANQDLAANHYQTITSSKESIDKDMASDIAELTSIRKELETLSEKLEREAAVADLGFSKNIYAVNDTDPDSLSGVGINHIVFIDNNGSPIVFKIDEEPDYNSNVKYANGEKNYWPDGSTTTPYYPTEYQLHLNPDGSYKVQDKLGAEFNYDYFGILDSAIHRNGYTYWCEKNGNQKIISITDGYGRDIGFTWSGDKLNSITDPDGKTVSYTYNASGRLESVTDKDGDTIVYTYYTSGEIEKIIKPDNTFRKYNYITQDGRNVVSSVIDEEGDTEYFNYDFENKQTTYTDPSGVDTVHHYDERYREIRIDYADSSYIENKYDDQNNLISVKKRSGFTTRYDYDENRNITRIDHPDGSFETRVFNEFSQLTEKVDSEGNKTTLNYDSKGNLIRSRVYNTSGILESENHYSYSPTGLLLSKSTKGIESGTESYEYDGNGNLKKRIDGEGNSWLYDYSASGLLLSLTDPLGNVTSYEYTGSGKQSKANYPDGTTVATAYTNRKDIDYIIDRDGNRFDYNYDAKHNLLSVVNPLGEVVTYSYDQASKITGKEVYSDKGKLVSKWVYEYEPLTGELSSQKRKLNDAEWAETQYDYTKGLLWRITDPVGTQSEYTYNSRDVVSFRTVHGEDFDRVSETMDYNSLAFLDRYTDPRGNETRYEYNSRGQVTLIEYDDGSVKKFVYDPLYRLVKSIDEEGYETAFTYSGTGKRTAIIHPDGSRESWIYNDAGQLESYSDRNGNTISYTSDAFGRITEVRAPEGLRLEKYSYNSRNQILSYTDGNGEVWEREYDAVGNLLRMIDPAGNSTSYEYSALGQVTEIVTPDQAVWQNAYDMAGRRITNTDPLGASTSYAYDPAGRILSETDPLGRTQSYSYNGLGHLTGYRDGGNTGADYLYDPAGNMTTLIQTGGTPYFYFYDERNRLEKEVNRLGDAKTYRYYKNGQIAGITDFNGNTTSFVYDDALRLSEKTFAGGEKEEFFYDPAGNLLRAINPSADLEYAYDPLGRMTKAVDHFKDEEITYSYDANSNRTALSWAGGNRTAAWTYDELNRPVILTDTEGEETYFHYDVLGRETSRTLPNGVTRNTSYNLTGSLTSITHEGGKNNESQPALYYAYNEAGQKIMQMDEKGRLTTWQYDEAARLSEASCAFAGGKSVTDFWERIYLGIVPEDIKQGRTPEEETLTGEIETLAAANPVLGELGFDNQNYYSQLDESFLELAEVFPEMKGHSYKNTATPKKDFAFKANWGHMKEFLPEEAKNYFNPGHLSKLMDQPVWTESFSYDQRGNIINKSNGWGDISYRYDEENRLLQAGEREYSYDNNGNQTVEQIDELTASYAYDGENRLIEVTTNHQGFVGTPGSLMDMGILYSYDAMGRRVSREAINDLQNGNYRDRFGSSGERESYLYDGLSFNVLAEGRDSTGTSTNGGWHSQNGRVFKPTSEYLRIGRTVIQRNDVTTEGHSLLEPHLTGYLDKSYYSQDSLGSITTIYNDKGGITECYNYDAYGRLTEGQMDGINRLGYNGKRMDIVTGRYDYGFRDYDPVTMRWMTEDPIRDGQNWYGYVNGDPINFVDPDGLFLTSAILITAAEVAIASVSTIIIYNNLHKETKPITQQQNRNPPSNITPPPPEDPDPSDLIAIIRNPVVATIVATVIVAYDNREFIASLLEEPSLDNEPEVKNNNLNIYFDTDYEETLLNHDPDCRL